MKKRGQISVFLIIVLLILIATGLGFYASSSNAKKKSSSAAGSIEGLNTDIVKMYAETCAKIVSEEALFNRLGMFGGYIDPDGNTGYGGQGTPDASMFQGERIPALLQPISEPESRLEKYLEAEFEKCFVRNKFQDIGIKVETPEYAIADISFNEEDVLVEVTYPLTATARGTETHFEHFQSSLPIRFKALYDGAVLLLENAQSSQPDAYLISDDCRMYNKNGLTNVYLEPSDDGNKIVRFVDFSTHEKNYLNSYILQFAVKNMKIEGSCGG